MGSLPGGATVHGRKKRRRRPSDSVEVELVACGPLLRVGRQGKRRAAFEFGGGERHVGGRGGGVAFFGSSLRERDQCEGVFGISGLDFFFCPEGNRDCGFVAVDL